MSAKNNHEHEHDNCNGHEHKHEECSGHGHEHKHEECSGHSHEHKHEECSGHSHEHKHEECSGHSHEHKHEECSGHAHEHGHGGHHAIDGMPVEDPSRIVPESSLQDKLLMLVAALCLAGLVYFGFLWATGMPPAPESSEHEHAGQPEHSESTGHGD